MAPTDEPTPRTEKDQEIPVPTRDEWERTVGKILNPVREPDDVPDELEDAARAELEYGADETDEG